MSWYRSLHYCPRRSLSRVWCDLWATPRTLSCLKHEHHLSEISIEDIPRTRIEALHSEVRHANEEFRWIPKIESHRCTTGTRAMNEFESRSTREEPCWVAGNVSFTCFESDRRHRHCLVDQRRVIFLLADRNQREGNERFSMEHPRYCRSNATPWPTVWKGKTRRSSRGEEIHSLPLFVGPLPMPDLSAFFAV